MIRTLCYSLLALGLAATTASAQEAKSPFHQSLAVGVHGGMLMSRVNFVPSVSQRLHSGLMGGVLLRSNVERGASLQLGGRHRIELEGRLVYGLGNIWSSARTSPYPQSSELRFGARLGYIIQL